MGDDFVVALHYRLCHLVTAHYIVTGLSGRLRCKHFINSVYQLFSKVIGPLMSGRSEVKSNVQSKLHLCLRRIDNMEIKLHAF
jgi:hypothetical protein